MGYSAIALLGIGIAGYLFLSNYIHTKFRVPKFQGHHLVYKCLYVGLFFFTLSALIYYCLWPLTSKSSFLFDKVNTVFPGITQLQFNFYCVLINTVFLAGLAAKGLNKFIGWAYWYLINHNQRTNSATGSSVAVLGEKIERVKNSKPRSETDIMLEIEVYQRSTDNNYIAHVMSLFRKPRMLLITLSNRKCYVCFPYQFNTPKDHEEEKEISIIPVATGYRHSDDLCLELTTYYKIVIRILSMTGEKYNKLSLTRRRYVKELLTSYRITISYDQIVSIASFDLKQYLAFKEAENVRRNEINNGRKGKDHNDERIING